VGYSLPLAFKDVELILQYSAEVRAPLSYASSLRDKFLAAIANKLDIVWNLSLEPIFCFVPLAMQT